MSRRAVVILSVLAASAFACVPDPDTETGKAVQTNAKARGYVLKADEGEALGSTRLIKASPRSGTQGGIVVLDQLPPGFATGFHAHRNADEFFYVISGTGTASIDEENVSIGPGDFIFVPVDGKHKMSVADAGPMELIIFLDKPGLDGFFREAHALYFSQSKPMSLEECNTIGEKYDHVCINEGNL